MEVEWQQRQWEGYARDGERIIQRFRAGDRDPAFLARILELLRTYVDSPRSKVDTQCTDQVMVRLVRTVQQHIQHYGFWDQIFYLWPKVAAIAAQYNDYVSELELLKQVAPLRDCQGDQEAAHAIHNHLLTSSSFSTLPVIFQVDLLHHVGTRAVWQGQLAYGKKLLTHCLAIAEQHPSPPLHRNINDQFGVRSMLDTVAMWELKAYTLNQLGVLAMFQGKFSEAQCWYERCLAELILHGEEDNLVCVAYQAIGRLHLHQGELAQAITYLEKGVALRHKRQEREGSAVNMMYLAAAHIECGHIELAERLLSDALHTFCDLNVLSDMILCHLYFGQLEIVRGNRQAGLQQWRQALNLLATISTPVIEQRVFITYLPWLLRQSEWHILGQVIRQLTRSIRQQELSVLDVGRLLIQIRFCW